MTGKEPDVNWKDENLPQMKERLTTNSPDNQTVTSTAKWSLSVQLVYKVKLDFVLEQLASASADGYGQEVWSDLFEEAKTNLMKIMVSVKMLFLKRRYANDKEE